MPIPVSEITRRINELISDEDMTELNYKHILNWLFEIGAFQFVSDDEGKMTRQPTSTGLERKGWGRAGMWSWPVW